MLTAETARLAPGCVAAIAHAGDVVALRALGSPHADARPTRPDTVFRIASMSKSFLAATVLSLRDEGRLDLHRPITDYVSDVNLRLDGEAVTVTGGQLLSNCSGLPEDNAWADRQLGASRQQIAALFRAGLPLTRAPGVTYQYSNIGQSLLGRAVEAVTGCAIEDLVRRRFIDPLGLTHTRFGPDDYPPGTDLAQGFRTFDSGATFIPEPYVGCGAMACTGGLFSTAGDVAAWMWFLGSAFTPDPMRPDLLAPASRLEMQSGRTPMTIGGDAADAELDARAYGYGLKVEYHRRFGRIVSHSGGLPGFSADMRWHAATGIGVVLFGNADGFNRATRVSERTLLGVLEATGAPADLVRPWDATIRAAEAIDEAIRHQTPLAGLGTISDNLLQDVPDDVRRRRLFELLAQTGPILHSPLAGRIIGSSHPSQLRWRVDCEHGALICDVVMVALPEPVAQTVNVQLAGPTGRKPVDEAPVVGDFSRVVG